MKKILHVITGLNNGGAEGVLFRLVINDTANHHIVISLMDNGKYGFMLKNKGIKVICLNMPRGRINIKGLLRLWNTLKSNKPDVVQTWMYHADLIGGVFAWLAGVKRICWNIRHTELKAGESSRGTMIVAKLCAFISNFIPDYIVCCAHRAVDVHKVLGYKANKMVVISNGYDVTSFSPNSSSRKDLRNELGIDGLLIGMVGRFDPQKNHENLIKALSLVKEKGFKFKCILVGNNMDPNNSTLMEWLDKYKLNEEVYPIGPRHDMPSVMNSLDLHVLSSAFGEGFPNVLAEAMACGTLCVTTNVGDASLIVGDTGWVVPACDSIELADAILEAIILKICDEKAWNDKRSLARERIVKNFSISEMVENYHKTWFEIL